MSESHSPERRPEIEAEPTARDSPIGWTYLSNHAHVLLCLVRDPAIRVRDVARLVGITERAVTRILAELECAGVIEKQRVGRRNHYKMHLEAPLRHPLENHATLADLVQLLRSR